MSIPARVLKKLEKHGEDFLINGETPARGIFQALSTTTMRTYFDDTEVMAIERPGLYLVTSPETSIDEGDTVVRDGRTFTVRKTAVHRIEGTAIAKIAMLS